MAANDIKFLLTCQVILRHTKTWMHVHLFAWVCACTCWNIGVKYAHYCIPRSNCNVVSIQTVCSSCITYWFTCIRTHIYVRMWFLQAFEHVFQDIHHVYSHIYTCMNTASTHATKSFFDAYGCVILYMHTCMYTRILACAYNRYVSFCIKVSLKKKPYLFMLHI
jgi:hypothetical protein